jgi:hypothetical protein
VAKLIRFEASAKKSAEAMGLAWAAIEATFLCPDYFPPSTVLISGCPHQASQYQTRESRASGQTPISVKSGKFQIYSPRTGELISTTVTLTFPWNERLNGVIFVPLIYALDDGESIFYVVTYGLTGRIMYLFIPALDTAFYELSEVRAKVIDAEFEANSAFLESRRGQEDRGTRPRVVGIIDMVRNYGHHMINHLSGIDILMREGCHSLIEEYWVYGREFFGPIERLYPEISGKVKYFSSRESLSNCIQASSVLAIRIGFNSFLKETRDRILRLSKDNYPFPEIRDRFPVIAVTIRTGDRRCTNLSEVIKEIYEELKLTYPTIGFLVDGWVFAEDEIVHQSNAATCLDPKFITRMREEFSACRDAFSGVPGEAVVRNLIGRSILESISGLLGAHTYISHVGTLQHKVAFFALVNGLVHGPQAQVAIDGGAFQAELGCPPDYLESFLIRDLPTSSERGAVVNDYQVLDPKSCAIALKKLLSV